jgi:hypothetical protein
MRGARAAAPAEKPQSEPEVMIDQSVTVAH